MAKPATKTPPTKAEWLNRVDAAVFKEAPSVDSTLRDGSVRDFAREFGVSEPVLSESFWRNEHHLVGVYGPLGPDRRLRARFVGAETHWDDHAERFYEQTADGAAKAAREICDLLRVGPSRLMNARENMRDAAHYLRDMQHYDRVVAENGSLLNGLNSFELLDMYRRAFKNAIASLQNAANQLIVTPQRGDYLARFAKSPVLDAVNGLRNQDVHNIMASMSIGTRIDMGAGGGSGTFVTFGSSYLNALGPTLPLDLQWRVPSEPVAEALAQLTAIVNEVPRS
jgi:hypothetical protein